MFDYYSSPDSPSLVSWPQFGKQKKEYMELGLTQIVKHNLKEDRVHFATVTLPQKLEMLTVVESGK